MTLASSKAEEEEEEEEAGCAEIVSESAGVVIVRGLEYATVVTNRATGRDSTFCADAE